VQVDIPVGWLYTRHLTAACLQVAPFTKRRREDKYYVSVGTARLFSPIEVITGSALGLVQGIVNGLMPSNVMWVRHLLRSRPSILGHRLRGFVSPLDK